MRVDDWISVLDFKEKFNNDQDYYWENGKMVMTKNYHIKRGYCCTNGCYHCPY
jgi:hypothetical protein